jgi:hypothetical protein
MPAGLSLTQIFSKVETSISRAIELIHIIGFTKTQTLSQKQLLKKGGSHEVLPRGKRTFSVYVWMCLSLY